MHKYLVTNLRVGFSFQEFTDTFGEDALAVAGDSLRKLERLNLIDIKEAGVVSRRTTNLQSLVARGLLYSEDFMNRIRQKWGAEYRDNIDYMEKLRTLAEE